MSDALNSRPFDRQLAVLLVESRSVDWPQAPAARLPYLLAARFDYDVKQGGFAQLLYNLQGNCLGEMEDMLIVAQAAVAHEYYIRAIHLCLADKDEYRRFLASNYTDANQVKSELQFLSVEYLRRRVEFLDEASAFLTRELSGPFST